MIRTPRRQRVALTYGRFDEFNQYQINLLRRVSALGNELIVGCTTDEFAQTEGRPCRRSYDARRATLERCRYVSRVVAKESWDQIHTDIVNYNVSVFVMDGQWAGQFDHLRDISQVQYLSGHAKTPDDWAELETNVA